LIEVLSFVSHFDYVVLCYTFILTDLFAQKLTHPYYIEARQGGIWELTHATVRTLIFAEFSARCLIKCWSIV